MTIYKKKNIDIKNFIKYLLLLLFTLIIFYLVFFQKIPKLYSTILFIILGTIIIIINLPVENEPLFRLINNDNLKKFKEYLVSKNLKPSNIHTFEYIAGKTPIIYAMERRAYDIFKYLIENDYDLKYCSERGEPIITFAAHSGELKFLELLLKNKNKINMHAINKKFGANALEIAIWREREEIVEALINAGMKFSIQNYNSTQIGKLSIPFENIPLNIKTILLKRFIFNKTMKQINMVNEFSDNKDIKSFKDNKIYWNEYLQFA